MGTNWWNINLPNRVDDLKSWVGDYTKPDKVYARQHIIKQGYKTILDCGCGPASQYHGFKADNYDIQYIGIDSCKFFIDHNNNQGITTIEMDLDNDLPIETNSYACVYAREILEHLKHYETAISNFIRIASKEVIISFFIKPGSDPDFLDYWIAEDLYHNKYNMDKLETFILDNPKVNMIYWKDIDDKNSVLHIQLKTT